VGTVLFAPYAWLTDVWAGPIGTGLVPGLLGDRGVNAPATLTLALLSGSVVALATALAGDRPWWTALRWGLPPATVTVLVGCVEAGAPWPVVPGLSLAAGLAGLIVATLSRPGAAAVARGVFAGLGAGAGLAGCLATETATIVALAAVMLTAAGCGWFGRALTARTAAWLAAVGAAAALAFASAQAAALSLPWTGCWVLAAAALAFAVSTLLRRRTAESAATEVAAHAVAVIAFGLTAGSTRHMVAICVLWGVANGLRALVPGSRRTPRVAAAIGLELVAYWLLLVLWSVTLIESYTVPAAAIGVLAGLWARRGRPDLNSWAAYGPALLAGIGPTLITALVDADGTRRLILGLVALVLVVGGSLRRLQAPVVTGAVTLVVLALHEIVRYWDLVPRWIPLLVGGLLLVGMATTYERRRRDLARLRHSVARMS
jgi:hypothetical protein